MGDFLSFEVNTDAEQPAMLNDGVRYEGRRFRAQSRLAGVVYGAPFGVDVVLGKPFFGAPDVIVSEDILAFAGIPPPTLRLLPLETHIAEKLHAYTMTRARPNSRIKDLPDLALLATARQIEAATLRAALRQTFEFRETHSLPAGLPAPPETWATPYQAMARGDDLAWPTLDVVARVAKAFLDPVLDGREVATWSPSSWRWSP